MGEVQNSLTWPEKKWYYPIHTDLVNPEGNGRIFLTESYGNQVDQYSAPRKIEVANYTYNEEGQLESLKRTFAANGLSRVPGLSTVIDFAEYDLLGNPLTVNVDVNDDQTLDIQYHYTYDGFARLKEVYANFDNSKELGNRIAKYFYDDAQGLIQRIHYDKNCSSSVGSPGYTGVTVDTIKMSYDVRNRLTGIDSKFYDETLYYDSSKPHNGTYAMGTSNYNGNMNAALHEYDMALFPMASNFTDPTYYGYSYDGINRLTVADAYSNQFSSIGGQDLVGDASFTYDRSGNILTLKRNYEESSQVKDHNWKYQYLHTTRKNQLSSIQSLGQGAGRLYAYDPNGNLNLDNARNLSQFSYGRANLPFELFTQNDQVNYLYSVNDNRIYKRAMNTSGTTIHPIQSLEYYLYDNQGKTLGVLDMNKGEWTWYVFGHQRIARLTPDSDQQPYFTSGNTGKPQDTLGLNNDWKVHVGGSLSAHDWVDPDALENGRNDGNYPLVLNSTRVDGEPMVFTDDSLVTYQQQNPGATVILLSDMIFSNGYNAIGLWDTEGHYLDFHLTDWAIPLEHPGAEDQNTDATNPPATPNPGQPYAYHGNVSLGEVTYYVQDHLGNTRVLYSPEVTNCDSTYIDTTWVFVSDSCYFDQQLEQTVCDTTWMAVLNTAGFDLSYDLKGLMIIFPMVGVSANFCLEKRNTNIKAPMKHLS
ncbi:hypothetical protein KFE98_01595 [bacterium SCSIO 12741]|nr:hypothetical protein KFE98_01595 [bacterium SCSIO 12741]